MTPANAFQRKIDRDIMDRLMDRLAVGKMGQEEAFKEDIMELAPEQQQELYTWMHNKLGLRIYK